MNYLIKPIIFIFIFNVANAQFTVGNYSKIFQDSSRSNRDILKYYADRLIISMENILNGIKDYNKSR